MSILDEFKLTFQRGTSLTKLIYLNIFVFLAIRIYYVIYYLFTPESLRIQLPELSILKWLSVPTDISKLIIMPWTIITYMFLHYDFIHILFNMLWLYWFGKIFLQHLSQKKLLTVYILGGIAGAVLFILFFNVFPAFQTIIHDATALGASASVIAIVISISFYIPNYAISILFFGPVKLKYIAIITILIDIISITAENPGGHIAHLGGAIFGIFFIFQYQKGKDITKWFDRIMDNVTIMFKRNKKSKINFKCATNDMDYNQAKAQQQEEINKILDKISKSGYDSLTKNEKNILFNMSNKK